MHIVTLSEGPWWPLQGGSQRMLSRRQRAICLTGLRKDDKMFLLGEISLLTTGFHLAIPPSKLSLPGAATREKSQAWNSPGRKHPALVDRVSWLSWGGLRRGAVAAAVDTLRPWLPTT